MIAFIIIIYFAGIYIGMVVMLPLCMVLHGEKDRRILFGLTAGIVLFIYLVFSLGLKVPLPMGLLGDFLK